MHGLFNGHGTAGSPGGPAIALPDPLVQMQQQLLSSGTQTVLNYATNAPDPVEQYLQLYVLNYDNDSGNWFLIPPASAPASTVSVGSGPLSGAPGVSSGYPTVTYRTQVRFAQGVTGYGAKWNFLAIPYAPADLSVTGDWHEDKATLMVYSADTQLSGLTYTATSKEAAPSAQQLEESAWPSGSAAAAGYLSPPLTHVRKLSEIAAQITEGASSPFGKAMALQDWFTAVHGFSYSTTVHLPDSTAGLVQFLTKTKQGYCQQTPSRWRCWPGWSASRRGSRWATRPGSGRRTAPGKSAPPTRMPGRSCTSGAGAGFASSRPLAAPAARGPRSSPANATTTRASQGPASARQVRPGPAASPPAPSRRLNCLPA